MKSAIQVAALLAVVVGGVFGVTFLTQHTRKPVDAIVPQPDGHIKKLLDAPERKANWAAVAGLPGYESYEVEKGTTGHYDFLVGHKGDKPVKLIMEKQFSCTCANLKVQFGLVPDTERAKLKDANPRPFGPQLDPYVGGVQWTLLTSDKSQAASSPITIPAADSTG